MRSLAIYEMNPGTAATKCHNVTQFNLSINHVFNWIIVSELCKTNNNTETDRSSEWLLWPPLGTLKLAYWSYLYYAYIYVFKFI